MNAITADQQPLLQALNRIKEVPLDRVSRELETTYRELSAQVVRLTAELEAARLARRAEHAERERLLRRLATLLDTLPGGVVIIDRNGSVTESNPQAVALLGEPLEGEAWEAIEARGCFGHNGIFTVGDRRLSLTRQALGETGEDVILLTDITEQHSQQEAISRHNRLTALGEMAARLAHQIRTPLASTTLYLSLLDSNIEPQRRRKICASLREQLGHMENLVTSMLGFVRGAPGTMAPVQIAEVLADALDACSADIEAAHAILSITPVDGTLQVLGSHDDIVAGLSNLIMNAIEASGGKPHIDIWAGAINSQTAAIRVADRGRGIDPSIIERIFDPFFTTRSGGTGLGLAVLSTIASQHGGRVTAQNRKGGGAEVTLELPMLLEDAQ